MMAGIVVSLSCARAQQDTGQEVAIPLPARTADAPLDCVGPWGIASGAEWSGDYPEFNPLLRDAGVRWLRYFPEWQTIQPRQGEWNWKQADSMVADARRNGIRMTGVFAYFATWASADGGTRRCPVKDMQYWRDYVTATMARYRNDIRHWEVWNEFNGSFAVDGTPEIYADMTREAYVAAKKIDPAISIGIGCANFDVGWLDAVIKAGAADHFDFVCVHPYENLGAAMQGGEAGFLSLTASLRRMLAANGQRADMPFWITEIGYQAPVQPDAARDAVQAEALVKAYVLAIAQGFERVFWFEARGPAYGEGTDHGIIRRDWSRRPAHTALRTMTELLGPNPSFIGWLELGEDAYGFVFDTSDAPVLAAWTPPDKPNKVRFDGPLQVTTLTGDTVDVPAGKDVSLTRVPVFFTGLPEAMVELARSHAAQPFPWGADVAGADEVTCRLGAVNQENGLKQTRLDTTTVVNGLTETWRRADFSAGGEGRYIYFRVDPVFAGFGTTSLEITIVARRVAPDRAAGMGLCYESLKGYRRADGWFGIPADDQWHEYTWTVTDANFVGGWGWNFRTDAVGSENEFEISEARVRKGRPEEPDQK